MVYLKWSNLLFLARMGAKKFSVVRSGIKIVQKILNSYFVALSGTKHMYSSSVALLKNKSIKMQFFYDRSLQYVT